MKVNTHLNHFTVADWTDISQQTFRIRNNYFNQNSDTKSMLLEKLHTENSRRYLHIHILLDGLLVSLAQN